MITKAHLTNIFKIGAVKPDHPESLRKLLKSFTENEMALKAFGLGSTECDFRWIHILSEKLDTMSAREWQLSNKDGKVKTLQEFRQFLDQRATALEAVQELQSTSVSPKKKDRKGPVTDRVMQLFQMNVLFANNLIASTFVQSLLPLRSLCGVKQPKNCAFASMASATVTQSGIAHRKQSAAHVVRNITHYCMTRI